MFAKLTTTSDNPALLVIVITVALMIKGAGAISIDSALSRSETCFYSREVAPTIPRPERHVMNSGSKGTAPITGAFWPPRSRPMGIGNDPFNSPRR